MSKIISLGTAVPAYGTRQHKILEFMQDRYQDETTSRKLKILFHNSGINTRYSAVPDFDMSKTTGTFFNKNTPVPDVEERIDLFKKHAVSLAIAAIHNAFEKLNTSIDQFKPTHLITVTCTGIYAPGIGASLIDQLNLAPDIFHTSINFMGCNAAFPALKIADMISKTDEKAKVLIVCVELCTLHFQSKNNHDNLLSNTIFGDGAAAVVIVSDKVPKQKANNELAINGFYSLLLTKGTDLMGWNITPTNFEMILDAKVPEFIGNEVDEVMAKASKRLNFTPAAVQKWAIHPGGKKILDTIKNQLRLNDIELRYSYQILSEYGNMSSPTILFVLNEIIKASHEPLEPVFSIGFGPGLSIETALFNYVE